jgi:thymidine kinase
MAYANMSTLGSHFLHLGKPTPTPHKKGTITLFCGPMFSGKTTHLILATRFKSRSDLKCLIVKYSQDKRHTAASDTVLTAFDNETQSPAISCGNHLGDLVPEMMKYDVISIDEGQFVSKYISIILIEYEYCLCIVILF